MDLSTRFVTAMSPAIVACALFFAQSCFAVEPAVLDLHSILGSAYPCSVPRAIEFLTEDELVVLAGPSPECFAAVDSFEIVAISLDGRVIARRPWTSTDMGLTLPSGRLVLPEFGGVTIVDENLRTIQTLRVAKRGGQAEIAATDTGILSITLDGQSHSYFGTPLTEVHPPIENSHSGTGEIVSTGDGSWQLTRTRDSLIETLRGGLPRTLADLSWVIPPCENHDLCQTDTTALQFQVVLGKKNRILITSHGVKVPITSSFGLVSNFRAQAFDLDTGAEVYREEDFFRPRERIAVLSPDGDRLVTSDGLSAIVHPLE